MRLAFLGPLAWLIGELGAFLLLTRTSQFNHSDMYLTVVASAVACVFVTKVVFDRLPAKQYSCPVCSKDFSADALDSEAQHGACGLRDKSQSRWWRCGASDRGLVGTCRLVPGDMETHRPKRIVRYYRFGSMMTLRLFVPSQVRRKPSPISSSGRRWVIMSLTSTRPLRIKSSACKLSIGAAP